MAANELTVTVDDRQKTLSFGETITTGSTYTVNVTDASKDGSLVLLGRRGELLAYAELASGTGTLSTNTDEMARAFAKMTIGSARMVSAVLHWNGENEGENAGVGFVEVLYAGGAWSEDTTGSLALYKGNKGDQGERGPVGPCSRVRELDSDLWHTVRAAKNEDGEWVLVLDQDGYEGPSDDLTVDTPDDDDDSRLAANTSWVRRFVNTGLDKIIGAARTVANVWTFTKGIVGNVTGDVTGDVTGNVTGNVTGDVTGNLTGNVTGDVTGNVTGNLTGNVNGAVSIPDGSALTLGGVNIIDVIGGVKAICEFTLSTTEADYEISSSRIETGKEYTVAFLLAYKNSNIKFVIDGTDYTSDMSGNLRLITITKSCVENGKLTLTMKSGSLNYIKYVTAIVI